MTTSDLDHAYVPIDISREPFVRLHRELGADFDLDASGHRAVRTDAASRVAMPLVSTAARVAHAAGGGCRVGRRWTDQQERFWVASLAAA